MFILDSKSLLKQPKNKLRADGTDSKQHLELKPDVHPVATHSDPRSSDTTATVIAFNRYRNKK